MGRRSLNAHPTSIPLIAHLLLPMRDIAYYPRSLALVLLDISSTQLRRDQVVLRKLEVEGFDYMPRDSGFSESALRALVAFRHLVRQRGRRRAICQIGRLSTQEIEQLITAFSSQSSRTNSFKDTFIQENIQGEP